MGLYGNTTVDEMAARALITVRVMNACKRNRLSDMNALCDYYQVHHTFLPLGGIGESANQNLIELCRDVVDDLKKEDNSSETLVSAPLPVAESYRIISVYRQITDKRRAAAEAIYGELVCSLQRRSIRGLFALYKSKNLAGLVKGLETKPTAFAELANLLLHTGDDLSFFLERLTSALSEETNEDWETKGTLRCLVQQINQTLNHRDKQMEAFLSNHAHQLKTGEFPVLSFIEVVISCNQSLPPTYKKLVLVSDFFCVKKYPLSYEDLSIELGIKPARVKQLLHNEIYRLLLFKEWENAIHALQSCGLVTPQSFRLTEACYHYFENGLPITGNPFTNRILAPLFAFFNPRFRLFCARDGNPEVFFSHKKIEAWFDIAAFFGFVEGQISKRIVHDYSIRLPDFLLRWCKRTPSAKEGKELRQFLTAVLAAKYHLLHNSDGSLTLYRTAKLTRREHILHFLKTQKGPCHTDDILQHVQKMGSQMKINSLITYLQSLKPAVQPLGDNWYELHEEKKEKSVL